MRSDISIYIGNILLNYGLDENIFELYFKQLKFSSRKKVIEIIDSTIKPENNEDSYEIYDLNKLLKRPDHLFKHCEEIIENFNHRITLNQKKVLLKFISILEGQKTKILNNDVHKRIKFQT